MKINKIWFAGLGIGALALLYGCGGGGGGGTSSDTTTTSSSATTTSLTGTFVDAPTKGLVYSASPSGISGTTDANGTYRYQAGDTVTFFIPTSSKPILIGSTKPVAPTGGNALTFVLALTNGGPIANVLQALDHSSNSGVIDVSGVNLDATNVANLNSYIASDGTQLPGNADPAVSTNVTNMLAAAQSATSYSGGGTPRTTVTGTFLTTVTDHLQSTVSNLSPTLAIPLSTRVPGKLAFAVAIPNVAGSAPVYTIRYRNVNGSSYVKTSQIIAANNTNYYPVITYSVPSSGNVFTETYPSYSANGTTYPTYTNTETYFYDDANVALGTYDFNAGIAAKGAWGSIGLDTSFSPSTVAGKTVTFTSLANDGCTAANPYMITFDSTGSSFTASCKGSTTVVPNTTTGFSVATVTNMPGVLAISLGGNIVRYWGLINGTSLSNGALASLTPGTSTAAGAGHIRAITAQ